MQDIFDYFIKYVGSSAYHSPAFMNCLPTIQFRYDLWYVDGGLYNIALGLQRLMDELGIKVRLNSEVTEVRKRRRPRHRPRGRTAQFHRRRHHRLEHGSHSRLREAAAARTRRSCAALEKFEPACSGLVLELGLDCQYPQLAHHNFFFSDHQREHFHTVFRKRQLPPDPTIYLVAASKTDPTVAPPGCDCLKILPHIPHIDDAHPLTREDYLAFKERVVDKLERMGLKDLRKHVVFEHCWTPLDIRAAILLQQRLDLRRRQRPLQEPRLQSAEAKHEVPEPLLRRRLGEPRRRHADGRALRPERRQEGRRVGPMLILLLVTLALWSAGFLLLGRLRPCAEASAPASCASCQRHHPRPQRRAQPAHAAALPRLAAGEAARDHRGGRRLDRPHRGTRPATRRDGDRLAAAARRLARQDLGLPPGRASRDRRTAVVRGCGHLVRAGRAWRAFCPATPAARSRSGPTTPSGSPTRISRCSSTST